MNALASAPKWRTGCPRATDSGASTPISLAIPMRASTTVSPSTTLLTMSSTVGLSTGSGEGSSSERGRMPLGADAGRTESVADDDGAPRDSTTRGADVERLSGCATQPACGTTSVKVSAAPASFLLCAANRQHWHSETHMVGLFE